MRENKIIRLRGVLGDYTAWTGHNPEGDMYFIRPGQEIEVEAGEDGLPLADSLRQGLESGHLEVINA